MLTKSTLAPFAALFALAFSAQAEAFLPCPPDDGGDPFSDSSGQYMVRFRKVGANAADDAAQARELERAAAAAGTRARWLRRTAIGDAVVSFGAGNPAAQARMVRALEQRADIEYVQRDVVLHPVFTPNDTRFGEMWNLKGTYGIGVPNAWDQGNGAGEVIAIIDTGLASHSDLNGNVLPGYDFISDDGGSDGITGRDADPSDPGTGSETGCGVVVPANWHGTHVAGTAAAIGNNGKGVVGVAYGARILPVRVLGFGGGTMSDIIDGIVWAAGGYVPGAPPNPYPASVINLSLGVNDACGLAERGAIAEVTRLGAVVVAAAGNEGDTAVFSPASCPGVVTVGSTNSSGRLAEHSNYGPLIDVMAPGEDILSTSNDGELVPAAESYKLLTGTSMAAPHVTGLVALMQSKFERQPFQVLELLKRTARPLPTCTGCGAGLVHANSAVVAAMYWPAADFISKTTSDCATSTSTFSFASTSKDPNNNLSLISWNINGRESQGPTATYTGGTTAQVTMTAKDSSGFWSSKTATFRTCYAVHQ